MMKTCLVLTLTIVASSFLAAQDTLTVEQVVRQVWERHPAITQTEWYMHAAEARVSETSGMLYPEVTTEASYAFVAPVAKLAFPGIGDFRLFPADNYDAHIGARYTVYDFGRTDAAIDLSKSRLQSGRDAIELTRSALAYQAVRVFYAVLFLEKSVTVQEAQISALQQHLEITKIRVSAGTATSFDVLTTQVRVAAAQNQKIDLENALAKQRALLCQYLGVPSASGVRIRGDFEHTAVPTSGDSLLQAAVRQRMEIKLAHDAELSAGIQQKMAALGDRPSLKLNLTYGLKNGYIPNLDVLRGNWVASIRAELPIFDGWRTEHRQEEAQATKLAEQAHLQDILRQVRSDVAQAVADMQSAASKLPNAELQVRLASDAVSIARSKYESGTVTNLDLLDAQAAEAAARLGNLQALFRLVLSRYELQQAIGASPTS